MVQVIEANGGTVMTAENIFASDRADQKRATDGH